MLTKIAGRPSIGFVKNIDSRKENFFAFCFTIFSETCTVYTPTSTPILSKVVLRAPRTIGGTRARGGCIRHFSFHGFLHLGNPETSYKGRKSGNPATYVPFRGNLLTGLIQGLRKLFNICYNFPFQVSGNHGNLQKLKKTRKLICHFTDDWTHVIHLLYFHEFEPVHHIGRSSYKGLISLISLYHDEREGMSCLVSSPEAGRTPCTYIHRIAPIGRRRHLMPTDKILKIF